MTRASAALDVERHLAVDPAGQVVGSVAGQLEGDVGAGVAAPTTSTGPGCSWAGLR